MHCHCPKSSAEAFRLAEDFDSAQEGNRKQGIKGRPDPVSPEADHKEPWEMRSIVCFRCRRIGHMAREYTNVPCQSQRGREALFDARILCNEQRDNGQVEMMDCSIGKTGGEKPKDKPTIW